MEVDVFLLDTNWDLNIFSVVSFANKNLKLENRHMLIRLMKINTGCNHCLYCALGQVWWLILFLLHNLNMYDIVFVCMYLEIYIEESM